MKNGIVILYRTNETLSAFIIFILQERKFCAPGARNGTHIMGKQETKKIRNVALLGHGSSGKTSLAEAMLYISDGTDRLGKTPDGNTVCDYDAEEIRRGFSLQTAIAPITWKDIKINVIDTPGYLDFVGEVAQGLRGHRR